MKRTIALIITLAAATFCAVAQDSFDKAFADSTLRLDLSFKMTRKSSKITIDSMRVSPLWGGRRVNLKKAPCRCSFDYWITDMHTGDTLYYDAKYPGRGSEGSYEQFSSYILLPLPRTDVVLHTLSRDYRGDIVTTTQHKLLRKDIAAKASHRNLSTARQVVLNQAQSNLAINLAILPEGYTDFEMNIFLRQAKAFVSSLFKHEAFARYRDRFNIFAVMLSSPESGITMPSRDMSVRTLLNATYESYGMDRLLTVPNTKDIVSAVEGTRAGHVIVLANSEVYGGSGTYGEYCIGYAGGYLSSEVLIHEFGHSFINLGDEYEEGFSDTYTPDVEPDEPNITTRPDGHKWQNLIDEGKASLIEGGGYQSTGVWRGCPNCIMRDLSDKHFCAVCTQAIENLIRFYTE